MCLRVRRGDEPGRAVATALAFLGILITAALFLRAYQRIFLGSPSAGSSGTGTTDLTAAETVSIVPLMVFAVVIGLFPRFLLDLIEPAASTLGSLLSR